MPDSPHPTSPDGPAGAPRRESVWDYPRPPRVERCSRQVEVRLGEHLVARSRGAWRVLETSHPPTFYLPAADVRRDWLDRIPGTSVCEWKGRAAYFDLRVGDRVAPRAAWSYPEPTPAFAVLADAFAFYAGRDCVCTLDGERVRAQPGDFYGGWITDDVVGPFKGPPGTMLW